MAAKAEYSRPSKNGRKTGQRDNNFSNGFDSETTDTDTEQTMPMLQNAGGAANSNTATATTTGKTGSVPGPSSHAGVLSTTTTKSNDISLTEEHTPNVVMQPPPPIVPTEKQPSPTGMLAWVGFGCCVFALACLSISFCSPYWLQTWTNSENRFKNIGLWHVCFWNYMQFKDDSQQVYSACWWVFDPATKYYKLREWLTPPWFISCQVLTTGCLLIELGTAVLLALIFLHLCPMLNHEYMQTYGVFAAASMMFLVTMISLVVAIVFGAKVNDRYWLPRPDQNYLSWGFGFLIISAIFTMVSGICLFKEGWVVYEDILHREDEYTKLYLESEALLPTMTMDESGYPPHYDTPMYGLPSQMYAPPPPPGYVDMFGPSSSGQPSYDKDPRSFDKANGSFEKDPNMFAPEKAPTSSQSSDREPGRSFGGEPGRSFGGKPFHPSYDLDPGRSFDSRPAPIPEKKPLAEKSYEKSYERRYSDASDDEDDN